MYLAVLWIRIQELPRSGQIGQKSWFRIQIQCIWIHNTACRASCFVLGRKGSELFFMLKCKSCSESTYSASRAHPMSSDP